jgi:N-acyl-D-aspartate/D-glutamate deacylase
MDGIKRRDFLKGTLKTAAVLSTAASGLLLKGCAAGKDFDLVVSGATLYDGSGGPPVRADVGILGDSIRLAVFDPARVQDRATWTGPARYPEGIPYVVVNGAVVVDHGEHSGRLPGKVLKRNIRGAVE